MSVNKRESILRRNPYRDRRSFVARAMGLSPIGDIAGATLSESVGTQTITWETATDWDNEKSHNNIRHDPFSGESVLRRGPQLGDHNPIWYWAINSGSGSIDDKTANAYDGTLNDSVWSSFTSGSAIEARFNGYHTDTNGSSDSNITWGTNIDYSDTATRTLEFWALIPSDANNGWVGGTDNSYEFGYGGPSTEFRWYWGESDGGANNISNTQDTIDGTWHYYKLVIDPGNSTYKLRIDETNYTTTSSKLSSDPNNPTFGQRQGGDKGFLGDHMTVYIAEARWCNSIIADSEDGYSDGTLTAGTKSFSTSSKPDLQNLSYDLRGTGTGTGNGIDLDVVGSPGTGSEEVVTQSLDGASSYSLTWSNSHTDFEIVVKMPRPSTPGSPELSRVELVN